MSQEALEMAREKLGLNTKKDENFVKPDGPPDESLEGVMAWKEKITARRFKAAELDRMALEAENEARRLRGEPPVNTGGSGMTDEEKAKREQEVRDKIAATAITLLEKGADPHAVAIYLQGSTPITPITLGGVGGVPAQGLTFKDMKEMFEMLLGKKEEGELKTIIADLQREVRELRTHPPETAKPLDPIAFAGQQAAITKAYIEALRALGLYPEGGVKTGDGKTLEVVKEENRHAEKMEELKTDKWYKEQLADTLGGLPEQIGEGIAGRIQAHEGGRGGEEGQEYVECEDCHTKVPIFDKTSNKIECPKCHAIYTKKAEAASTAK